jgi:hypothetical protein
VLVVREPLAAISLIERAGSLMQRVDDNGRRGDLLLADIERATQSIEEQCRTQSPSMVALVDGETSQENGGHERIPRQLALRLSRLVLEPHRRGGQGVVASASMLLAVVENEGFSDVAIVVLPSPLLQAAIE